MRTITITEDVKLPGTNVILEKGDKVQVLPEKRLDFVDAAEYQVNTLYNGSVKLWLLQLSQFINTRELEKAIAELDTFTTGWS